MLRYSGWMVLAFSWLLALVPTSLALAQDGAEVESGAIVPSPLTWVESGDLLVGVSMSGRTLYGYSVHTGEAHSAAVVDPNPDVPPVPVMGGQVCCVRAGNYAYGFGAEAGLWCVQKLKAPRSPIVSDRVACVADGERVYAIGPASTRWAAVQLPAAADPVISHNSVRVMVGTKMYLFSGTVGLWEVIDLAVDVD